MANFDVKDMYEFSVLLSDGNRISIVASCFSEAIKCAHLVTDKDIISICKVNCVNVLI